MRGLLVHPFSIAIFSRITPACAGTTNCFRNSYSSLWDHPRLCGDYVGRGVDTNSELGSPPPVRGLLEKINGKTIKNRITPACAGTTWRSYRGKTNSWDHPRLCGDYLLPACRCKVHLGSPPPVRGLLTTVSQKIQHLRITPACAGTTFNGCKSLGHNGDHPRLCGDYYC